MHKKINRNIHIKIKKKDKGNINNIYLLIFNAYIVFNKKLPRLSLYNVFIKSTKFEIVSGAFAEV